jgi:hypothetical protein
VVDRWFGIVDRVTLFGFQVGVGLEAIRLVAAYLRFQAEVPDFSGDVARRVVELLQVHGVVVTQLDALCLGHAITCTAAAAAA